MLQQCCLFKYFWQNIQKTWRSTVLLTIDTCQSLLVSRVWLSMDQNLSNLGCYISSAIWLQTQVTTCHYSTAKWMFITMSNDIIIGCHTRNIPRIPIQRLAIVSWTMWAQNFAMYCYSSGSLILLKYYPRTPQASNIKDIKFC